ncbi:MAG TPA: molecular chaperone SurA, partial [Gammaproteobacteria bacterium]|nr:molecular chaperone SurA [Gammaproteobacteria bacterium]
MRSMKTRHMTLLSLMLTLLLTLPAQAEIRWLDKIAAIAGEDIVTTLELEQEMQLIANELRARQSPMPPADRFEKQVLERLIVQKLQLQKAHKSGIKIDDITLNKAVENIASENNMSVTRFRKTMQEEGLSYVAFRNNLRSELTLEKLHRRVIGQRINITDQ